MKICIDEGCRNEPYKGRRFCLKCDYKRNRQKHLDAKKRLWLEDKSRLAEKNKEYRDKNREELARKKREFRKNNKQRVKVQKQKYYQRNKKKHSERNRAWREKNKAKVNASNKSRIKRVQKATPPWADMKAIKEFYFNCPAGHHVDHVIPINAADISGLHVLENLQYLPASENIAKHNRVDLEALNGTF